MFLMFEEAVVWVTIDYWLFQLNSNYIQHLSIDLWIGVYLWWQCNCILPVSIRTNVFFTHQKIRKQNLMNICRVLKWFNYVQSTRPKSADWTQCHWKLSIFTGAQHFCTFFLHNYSIWVSLVLLSSISEFNN